MHINKYSLYARIRHFIYAFILLHIILMSIYLYDKNVALQNKKYCCIRS